MTTDQRPATATNTDTDTGTVVVGVIPDPIVTPTQIAQQLTRDLPQLLSSQLSDSVTWHVEISPERLPSNHEPDVAMVETASSRKQQYGWDLAVCVTDLPLWHDSRPIVADVSSSRGVIVVSLPAFGAMALHRRVRGVVAQLIADLWSPGTPPQHTEIHRRRRLPALASQFRRVTPPHPGVDVRVVASRGISRLLIGMVRDNRPWQLVFGLRGPMAGAFAFSAFYLISTSVWQLAVSMGPLRLLAAALGSVAVMVGWLIAYHHLWEQTRRRPPSEREQAVLFNTTTVLTLTIGVGCMYAALYLVNLGAGAIVLTPAVLGQFIGSAPGFADYAVVMLLVTAAGTVAGAVGSGFETEAAIRQAAYSYRDRERRDALRDLQQQREQEQRSGTPRNSEET